jgi:hypothetical protein
MNLENAKSFFEGKFYSSDEDSSVKRKIAA